MEKRGVLLLIMVVYCTVCINNTRKSKNISYFNYPKEYNGLFYSSAEVAVVILARGGSKGVRLKNLQKVGGTTLLSRTIHTAKAAGFHDITVSTDHPLIALESIKDNVTVFHRSFVTATDWAPSIWGALEFLSSRPNVTFLILMQVTSPFTLPEQLRSAFDKISRPVPFDCVFSVTRSYKLRWQLLNGKFYPANFQIDGRVRRQDWNGEFLETGAFYITRRSLLEKGKFQNYNCMMSTETVTFEDLEATDVISVELVPERKGLILKHCEYYVSSRRHGTTVSRRYNEFLQLYDVLYAKYPYRAICRLPPKRVVVGGGSSRFLLRRRAALQRWLTLVARHPILAHDADLRIFLCESTIRLDKPKHDEFVLAGTQEDSPSELSTEDMQAAFVTEQEQLRLAHLGLGRLTQIFEKVQDRCGAERSDMRELGAALSALAALDALDAPRCAGASRSLTAAAQLACSVGPEPDECSEEEGSGGLVRLATDACGAYRELVARLSRGLHAERAAAAAAAPRAPQAAPLRHRHRYALRAALQEGCVARAYVARALQALPALAGNRADAHAQHAALWQDLHRALTYA